MAKSIYDKLLLELPMEVGENIRDYATRIPQELIDKFNIDCRNSKVLEDNIRRELKRQGEIIRVKRSETLNSKGEIISEKYGYVKPDIEVDEGRKIYTGGTTNPNGQDWLRFKFGEVDYIKEIKDFFSTLEFDKAPTFEKKKSKSALKVTITDDHVGMAVDNSLFQYKYGKNEFNSSLDLVFESIMSEYLANGRFDKIIFQNLGDGLDGYNGLTTRGGHSLEQNMSNNEAYRIYVHGKLRLIKSVIDADIANDIEVYDTANCNHSGDFGFTASYAIKLYLEAVYTNVKYTIFEKFIEHFYYGEHCFIQTHGKDKQYMKSGLPLKLDDKTQRFFTQYIERNKISCKFIHVEKADLHQIGYNKCKLFDYRNFMSFAPPSNWVQHNFGDGYSGYSLQIISENKPIKQLDCFIEYDLV